MIGKTSIAEESVSNYVPQRTTNLLICLGRLFTLICVVFIVSNVLQVDMVFAAESASEQLPEDGVTVKINPLEKKATKAAAGPPAISLKYFYIERPKLDLKFSYELENESIMNLDEDREDTVREFREGLGISTKGWLYHPALLSYVLDFDPEWIQTSGNSEFTGNSGESYLNAYSLDAALLPLKPYTVHFFGKKYQNSFRNTFSERAIIDTDTYGSRLALKYKTLPTALSYSNTKVERRGALLSSRDQDIFDLAMNHQTLNSFTQLNANYRDILQTNEGDSISIETSNNYLRNTYFLNRDLSKKLLSDIFYNWTHSLDNDDSTSFTSSDLRWTEQLQLTHRENLWTNYKLLYQKQQIEDSEIDTKSVGASLSHLLYENLTSVIEGEVSRYGFTQTTNNVYTGKLNFQYSRSIPWGMLNLNTGVDPEITRRNANNNDILATTEQHMVTTGGVTFLRQENIDPDSIRVTDTTSTIVYIEDQDYTVEIVGSLIRIRPTLIGNITDGQELLVSYQFASTGEFDDLVLGHSAGISVFLWSTLRLSYDYSRRTQDILSGIEPENLIDDRIQRTQVRLFWKWTDTTVSYDNFETSLSSSRSTWRINEELKFKPMRSLHLDFSGYVGNTLFKNTDEKEDFNRVATKITWYPAYWYRTGLEAYHYQISGNVQDASNSGILAFIDLHYGKWTCNLSYRYLDQTDEISDFDRARQSVLLKITRAIW